MARTQRPGARKVAQLKRRPARSGADTRRPKGRLLIVGGHDDRVNGKVILRALVHATNGGKLVVATLASENPNEMWEEYESTLRSLGAKHVYQLRVETRAEAESPRAMSILEGATTVFFTGGDQLRLTSLIGDTPVYSRCYEIFSDGGMIAGTSAGAAMMSETMLVGGDGQNTYRINASLKMAPGMGFAKDMVVDQHFAERGRIGRLLGVVAQNPRILGVGIDENTAIEVQSVKKFRVIGTGGVYVLDGSDVIETNIAEAAPDRTVSILGIRLHVLSQGDEFDLMTRTPTIGKAEAIDEELGVKEGDRTKDGDE